MVNASAGAPDDGGATETQKQDARETEREEVLRDQAERIRSGRARQGRIVLDTKGKRALFIAGLGGIVALGVLLAVFA
jgi:hypothetical protein